MDVRVESPYKAISDFIFIEDTPKKADIIFVPGGSSPQLMEKACQLFLEGWAPYILPSGGKNSSLPQYENEWQYFLSIAKKANIPEDRIILEDKATNTFENAKYSRIAIQNAEMRISKAILVCKSFHARRALLTYQYEFSKDIEFIVIPVIDNRGISKENWINDQLKINKVLMKFRK